MAEGSDKKQTTAVYKVMVRCYLESHAEPGGSLRRNTGA